MIKIIIYINKDFLNVIIIQSMKSPLSETIQNICGATQCPKKWLFDRFEIIGDIVVCF